MSRRPSRRSAWQQTQSTRNISQRSIPTKKANRKTEDIEEAEEIDISNTIQLERDRIQLQKELRSIIKELVEIRNENIRRYNKWRQKYEGLDKKYQSIQEVDSNFSKTLQNINSLINEYIKQDNEITEELAKLYKGIPKKEGSKSLTCRLKQERSNSIRIKKDLDKSEKEQTKHQNQLRQLKSQLSDHSLDKSKREKLKRQKTQLSTQIENIKRDVAGKRKDYNDETKKYDNKANELSKNNRKSQMKSIRSLTTISQKFVNILTLQSPSSKTTPYENDDSSIDDEEESDQ